MTIETTTFKCPKIKVKEWHWIHWENCWCEWEYYSPWLWCPNPKSKLILSNMAIEIVYKNWAQALHIQGLYNEEALNMIRLAGDEKDIRVAEYLYSSLEYEK